MVGLLGDEATVKYYRPRAGRVELAPANPHYQPIVVGRGAEGESEFRILGVVSGVLRIL